MKFIGKWGSADSSVVGEYRVKEAIIRKGGKEIAIDYEYQSAKEGCTLKSKDGIHFSGEYEVCGRKTGTCHFTLYKNDGEYILFGKYSSLGEGQGYWWIELKPEIRGKV